ncbi:sodium:proton antiporter [Ruficoccus amylovorans]|uniref:Sodium:proton antiporter n=1 Tax=Ruficoccus amylovorans TaxID=1804625 RepID=A0A842HLN1_9BACT|nr:Na+/H+ antiporter NhaC family protein [Ruficoccus amylovorans]MBC2596031.1 sodium:proton antiporter [Ruficoccus amylovorans]
MALSLFVGQSISPSWYVQKVSLDKANEENVQRAIPADDSLLWASQGSSSQTVPTEEPEWVRVDQEDGTFEIFSLTPRKHWGYWSFLPAVMAVALCFVTREPITALTGGILAGALLMHQYDVAGDVLIPALATRSGAGILVLYLWFLGGIMGIWSRNGAALAFAELMTRRFVRGPVTARLVAWFLGVLFFQGGTLSTVLVGTTVRPVADKEKISHEELSYIVDSTASPIAILIPFNAWAFYLQGLIFVSGAGFLATETDRIRFFITSVPLSFYAMLAVLFTLLLCFDKLPFLGAGMREAIRRSRETGQLDRPGAQPMLARELETSDPPEGYRPSVWEFFVPLGLIVGVALGTAFWFGSPDVHSAFGIALLVAFGVTLARGMSLEDAVGGLTNGLKGVVYGSVVLLLAVIIGSISRNAGGGIYLMDVFAGELPFWMLPVLFQVLTMFIAFSTGTSFGTFAVALPLVMPLAWATALSLGMEHPVLYLSICFAAVINGSVYGDQCSPISDTTVLSSMATGCDLMDHVRTQIGPATIAAVLAGIGWTAAVFLAL